MHASLARLSLLATALALCIAAKQSPAAPTSLIRRAVSSSSLQPRTSAQNARRRSKRSSTSPSLKRNKQKRKCRHRRRRDKSTYTLVLESLGGYSFFDHFDFFTSPDPTHGAVDYVSREAAWAEGLVYVPPEKGNTVIRADSWTGLTYGENRRSVRITSREKVRFGSVVVADFGRIPFGAFWTVGDNWPAGGEIDIVEGVHNSTQNQMTLHTAAGCTLASSSTSPMNFTGNMLTTNCDALSTGNVGCGVQDPSTSSFGSAFNAAGGGVFAMVWDEDGIAMYFFPRDKVPSDLSSNSPLPLTWGQPSARFSSSTCDPQKYFSEQTIVLNISLGGDWGGAATYNSIGYEGDWRTAVMDPRNFVDAAWEVRSIKVYEKKQ
ncbi:hypothetical protein JCM8547_009285 [Rhodosporidiobolus lusitaniae]